jgi:hypothetical protein
MLIPVRCPTCTRSAFLRHRAIVETTTSRLFRCPACRSVVWQARAADPARTPADPRLGQP